MLKRVRIQEYRSLLDLELNFDKISMISGSNGAGKSNCYKALALLKALALGRFAESIAGEGGMESVLWSGVRKGNKAKRLIISVEHSEFEYHVEVGIDRAPPTDPNPSMFLLDPKIREESLKIRSGSSLRLVGKRKNSQLSLLDDDSNFDAYDFPLMASESFLSQIREPAKYPFVAMVKAVLGDWKFYHEFDTSSRSPLRVPQVAFWSPQLADDGINLASTVRTIWESGFKESFDEVLAIAFPQMHISIQNPQNRLLLGFSQQHLSRQLSLLEISDGTLRFLCLTAALLSSRKPALIVLNEPEMSLNESVYPAIAKLINLASKDSQIIIVTHATELANEIRPFHALTHHQLALDEGSTKPIDMVGKGKMWKFD